MSQPKVLIKAVHPLAFWKYDCKGTECQICHKDLTSLCLACSNKSKDNKSFGTGLAYSICPVVIGECKDGFHSHCAETWYLNQSNCAVCQKPWKIIESDIC